MAKVYEVLVHTCPACGRVGGRYIIESALNTYNFGFSVTYDGDRHKIMFGTKCNHCGAYFEDEKLTVYCKKCI